MKKPKAADQFVYIPDPKIRSYLVAFSDMFDERSRKFIQACYDDQTLQSYYQGMRNLGFDEKGHGAAKRREILRFPNPLVAKFVNDVMSFKHGSDWLQHKKLYKDEVVVPWLLVHPHKL